MTAATYMGLPVEVVSVDETGPASATIHLRFLSAAERKARRKALLEEARAWRRIARKVAARLSGGIWTLGLCDIVNEVYGRDDEGPGEAMYGRIRRHLNGATFIEDVDGTNTYSDTPRVQSRIRVLAALFLALECEDEASALRSSRQSPTPTKRKPAQSARRGRKEGR